MYQAKFTFTGKLNVYLSEHVGVLIVLELKWNLEDIVKTEWQEGTISLAGIINPYKVIVFQSLYLNFICQISSIHNQGCV